ncbi:LysR family transcriptional regulator [[Clostridium] symbiosum]|uniref:LysR family transcriptional regulator n=1 Tax=Clostridium symbiosum TaxID=1512 RepID=UPI001D091686|nr:LysR family transcriptional regulator [[Clostridium] symbiosum]MCB6608349.1 LysR family transcriptional regulator [[Clostridium] symbiosum]MCB6932899.1 LysR family transcriptional regulator [[Clostridium] symbiosum]
MNLQWLYYFNTIAELEHYTRAAEQLHVSQSNLSHAIKELEEELGAELFERKGRNIKLTKYGEIFLPYVQQTINSLEAGITTLKEYIDPNVGTIVLAGFQSIAQFATDLMVRYQSETNRLEVQFQYSQEIWKGIQGKLLDGSVDLILGTRLSYPQIDAAYIGTHQLVVLVPEGHELAGEEKVDLKKLDGENFIAFDNHAQLRGQLEKLFDEMGINPNVVSETPNDQIIYGLVAARRGVSIVPYPLAGAPYNTRILPIANDIPQRRLYLQWNKERYIPPAAKYFRDYIIRSGEVFDQYLEHHGMLIR